MKYLRDRHSIYTLLSVVLLTSLLLSSGGSNAFSPDMVVIPVTGSPNSPLVSFSCGWETNIVGAGCWHGIHTVGSYSFQRVTSPVRTGSYAARIELRPGDPLVFAGQRAEVLLPTDGSGDYSNLEEGELIGTKYYAFSVLLPTDWSTAGGSDGYWAVILQLHGPDVLGTSPAFAFETRSLGPEGDQNFAVDMCAGDISRTGGCDAQFSLTDGSLNLGHWTDFVMAITYAKDASGSLNIWRRNEGQTQFTEVLSTNNTPTLQYSSAVDGGVVGPHYWKMGLYRNASSPLTNVLYLDGFTRADSFDAVVAQHWVPSLQISGTAGVAGATLSYTEGGAKMATSAADGSYSFSVPFGWSGMVRPSKAGYFFSNANTTYNNVTTNQTAQDYTAAAITTDRPADFDFNGDGKSDISIYRQSNATWYIYGVGNGVWGGMPGDIPVPGDYNADGVTDVGIYRPSNGTWSIQSVGNAVWGSFPGDIPVPGDYNGDGKTDVAIYRPSTATWYIHGVIDTVWRGGAGDIPVQGDYNADGVTEVGIYEPSTGTWLIQGVGNAVWGGIAGDIPLPADYTGDGKTDVAIYRPSTGTWYIQGYGNAVWGGVPGDIPVPADYNGDGTADIAIYRPSTGEWLISGVGTFVWGGVSGDYPLEAPDTNGDGTPYQ